jgi:hypothetical protein
VSQIINHDKIFVGSDKLVLIVGSMFRIALKNKVFKVKKSLFVKVSFLSFFFKSVF